jgi:hypothetical protein
MFKRSYIFIQHLLKGFLKFLLCQLYNLNRRHGSHSESLPPTAALQAGVSLHPRPIKHKESVQPEASNSTKGPHKIPRRDRDPEFQSPEIHTARARVRVSSESGSSNDDALGMGVDLHVVAATNKDEEPDDWQGK